MKKIAILALAGIASIVASCQQQQQTPPAPANDAPVVVNPTKK